MWTNPYGTMDIHEGNTIMALSYIREIHINEWIQSLGALPLLLSLQSLCATYNYWEIIYWIL